MKNREILLILLFIDLVFLNISFFVVAYVHYGLDYDNFSVIQDTFLLLNSSWIITYLLFISGDPLDDRPLLDRIRKHGTKYFVFLAIASIQALALGISGMSRITFFGSVTYFFTLTFLFSNFLLKYIRVKKDKKYDYSVNLIVGAGKIGDSVKHYFDSNPHKGEVVGFLDDYKTSNARHEILGKLSDLQNVFDRKAFDQLIIAIPVTDRSKIRQLIDIAEYNGVRPRVVPNYFGLFSRSFNIQMWDNIPIVNIREFPLENYANRFWKRGFDLLFSCTAMILILPIILIIAIAIKLDSKGPVFYKPVRLGRKGVEFTLYKFRSMAHNDDSALGTKSTSKDDQRITRVGSFIRKYSLDELPQFINVIKHDMSVVGPRPHRIILNKILQEKSSNYLVRHYILPGVTGWAQVNGWRGPTETRIQYKGRTLHDLWYIENWSFILDLYIIFLTVFGKKARKNAF